MKKIYKQTFAVALALCASSGVFTESHAQRTVFIEKMGGTWCGHCPYSSYIMDSLELKYPNLITVSLHTSSTDPMTIPENSVIRSAYFQSFPASMVDRHKFEGMNMNVDYMKWDSLVPVRLALPQIAELSGNAVWHSWSNAISVHLTTKFLLADSGEFRWNVYVLEDSVTGDSKYDQRNYYFNNSPGHPLHGKGDPIKNYVHEKVVRHIAGGAWGQTGSIPEKPVVGMNYAHSFTINAESFWRPHQVRIIAVLQRYSSNNQERDIVQAARIPLSKIAGLGKDNQKSGLRVYPHPASGNSVIGVPPLVHPTQLRLLNAQGREISRMVVQGGQQLLVRDLTKEPLTLGLYFLELSGRGTTPMVLELDPALN